MSNNVPTTTTGTLTLANGTPVRIVISPAGDQPPRTPGGLAWGGQIGELPTFILQIATDVADAASIGQAILDLMHAGEWVAHQSREAAERLDATVAEVEAARAAQRGEQ